MPTTAMTCILFDGPIDEVAAYYTALVPGSEVLLVQRFPEGGEHAGEPVAVDFTVAGARFQLIAGGPQVALTEVVSIKLELDEQSEVDRLWDTLIADGGKPSQCGWLSDKYGLSWQLVPRGFTELMSTTDAATQARLFEAMMGMTKLEMPVFEAIAANR